MGLTRTAIQRPVFVLMLMVAAILLGTISYRSMRVEQNPDVSFGIVTVTTIYPGSGPEEIAEQITRKIEEAVSGVNGLREVTSVSQEGVSIVTVTLELGANVDNATNDVRSKVDQIVNTLPEGSERPTIGRFDSGSEPVLYYAVSSNSLNNLQLRDLADNVLSDRFARLKGVAQVGVTGGDEREIQIQVKPEALLAYGIGINDVLRQVQSSNVNIPAGRIVTETSETSIRVPSEFTSLEKVRETVLTVRDQNDPNATPRAVKLTDIAEVRDSAVERRTYSRLGAEDAVVLAIQKSKDGNAVEISKAAGQLVPELEKQYGLTFTKTLDTATFIEESLFDLNFALYFGIFLVTAIVFVFLHNFRGMLIVAIAIPLCIFATFICMKLFGFTINNLSMLALSLAVGVLVDDAIVVLENIYRHLKMGEDPREAALNGRGEIGLAAIAITLADVVVFLPIGFMGGITGQFFKPLALSFAACVVISLLVSFTVTPMLAARWYRKGENVEEPRGRFAQWFERQFGKLENAYRRTLEWSLKHRWFVFISGNVVLFAVFAFIGGSFAGKGQDNWIRSSAASAIGFFILTIVIGLAVFGFQFLRGTFSERIRPRIYLPLTAISLVLLLAAPMPMPIFLKVGFAFLVPLVLLGLVAVFANLITRTARYRVLGFTLLYALVFPIAAIGGSAYQHWKGGDVFQFAFFPPFDAGTVQIDVELPPGSNLAQTQAVVERVEKIAMEHPDVRYVLAQVGTLASGGFEGPGSRGSQYARLTASLWPKEAFLDRIGFSHGEKVERLRKKRDTDVAADLTERVGRIPGAEITVAAANAQGFGRPIQMSFTSDNRPLLLETVSKIKRELQAGAIKGVINPKTSSRPGKPELELVPDRQRLADAGLTPADFAGSMRVLYEGNDQTTLRVQGREYPVRVMMSVEDRNDPQTLDRVPIAFNNGQPIFMRSLAQERPGTGADQISRRDRQEEVRIEADLLPGYAAGSIQQQIDAWLVSEKLIPEGVRTVPLGQADAQAREQGFLFGALGLGFLLVYMLLASLYDNLLYPLIIQLAQPQAFVGALLALMLLDKSLNIVGFIGLITLVGLVGKNAILLVDYANTLRDRGRNRHDALVEAGPVRLRPIMMTTLALILGTLPVAAAIGRGSEFRETIGIIIIGGITLSTLLTLLVIPCSYTIFDDLSVAAGKLMAKINGRGRSGDDGGSHAAELTTGTSESEAKPAPAG